MRTSLLCLAVVIATLPAAAQYEATLIADINPGLAWAFHWENASNHLTVYDERLFFAADDGEHGRELWAYDAATEEPALVADINPGAGSSISTAIPFAPIVYSDLLFFPAYDSEHDTELWAYDATTDTAFHVADIWPGAGTSAITELTIYDGRLFFTAVTPSHGRELWAYDAATDEASLVADIDAGSSSSSPADLTVHDGRLFFRIRELLTPGESGTLWAYDSATGVATPVSTLDSQQRPNRFIVYDDRLFFSAVIRLPPNGPGPNEYDYPWVYDATTNEAQRLLQTENWSWRSGPVYPTVYDDKLFVATRAPWSGITAYSAAEDQLILASNSHVYVDGEVYLTVFDDRLFYPVALGETGVELEFYDATTSATQRVTDIYPGGSSLPSNPTVYDGNLFFTARDGTHGRELWALSPTPVTNEPSATPQLARLRAPHPNPAQDRSTITFAVNESGPVRVEVFDVLGRRVALLADGPVAAGEHTLTWEAGALPSGLYLVRLTADDAVQTQRLTLAR